MPHLLDKMRAFRRRRKYANATRDTQVPKRSKKRWWIVAACLAAFLTYYFWISSARLLNDPIRIDYGPTDAHFGNAMGPLTGADFVAGNSVGTLLNGDGFFPPMLEAIRSAEKTITLETYIWASGYISNQFINALSERARAGVKVHCLMDGMGGLKFNRSDRDRLRAAGVELHVYGREHWWQIKPDINHRTHRKVLVIDGKVGFTGGMCIDDKWLGNAHLKELWRETQVRVEGPVVRQMQAVFAHNWMQTTSSLLLGEDYFPALKKSGSAVAQCFKSGPSEGAQAARLGHLFAIASARKSIDLANAYFVPDDLAIDMLVEALKRGVKVRITFEQFKGRPVYIKAADYFCGLFRSQF